MLGRGMRVGAALCAVVAIGLPASEATAAKPPADPTCGVGATGDCVVSVALATSPSETTVLPGGQVTYVLDVTNTGEWEVPFASVVVTDPGATVTAPADTSPLAPGATRRWTATRAVAGNPRLCGVLVASSATVTLVDLPTGFVASDEVRITAAAPARVAGGLCTPAPPVPTAAPALLRPAQIPTLVVTKTGPARAFRGGVVGYRIRVSNIGTTDATGVSLRDRPPEALRVARIPAGARKAGRGAVWNIGTVTAGQSVTRLVTFRVSRTSPSRLCNVVEVTSAEGASDRGRACMAVRTLARPSVTG